MCGPGSMHCSERARRTRLLRSVSLLLAFVSDFRCHKMAHIPPVTTVVFQAGRIQKKLTASPVPPAVCLSFLLASPNSLLSIPLSHWLVLTHLATAGGCGLSLLWR